MLQRPRVADDAQHPLAGQTHLVEHLVTQVVTVAERQIHLGDTLVGLRNRHFDVVDERGEQRPLLIRLTQRIQVAELLARRAQTIPCGQIDARLRPSEHPRDGAQIVKGLRAQTTLGRTGTDRQQTNLGERGDGREPFGEVRRVQQVEEALVRGLVELISHRLVLRGHLRVDLVNARSGLQKRCRGDRLDVTDAKHRVAVPGEDDLALLGELETAIDRAGRLREHRAVRRAAATTDSAATTVEQRQIDIVFLGPLGDTAFSLMQREDGCGRAGVLGGIRVAEHDLHLAAGCLETCLYFRNLDDFIEHIHRVLEILKLFEQRNHIDGRHILRMGEGETVELVHVAHVLSGLREGDDVTACGLDAIALLDGTQSAEGVEHLMGHRLQFAAFAVQTMLADVLERARMHD